MCRLLVVLCQQSSGPSVEAEIVGVGGELGVEGWEGSISGALKGILLTAALAAFKGEGLRVLLVNSDLAPKLEGGVEMQKEPLAWLQNRSFSDFSCFKSRGIPIHWEPLGI